MVALAPAVGVVAAAHVVVQDLERQRHDDGAAVAVHDGLGQAGGAAAVDDPQRVVEGQPQRLESAHFGVVSGHGGAEGGAGLGRLHGLVHLGRVLRQVGVQHHVAHAGQGGAQFGHHAQAVVVLAAVGDAVAGDQRHRFDLFEAVEHRVGAHVGGAHAPHRTDADHRQEGDHGFRDVGQVGGHAVARLHALRLQVQRQRGDLAPQLRPAQFAPQAFFVVGNDGREARRMRRVRVAEHLLRVIDLRPREPGGPGHDVAFEHRRVRGGRAQVEVVPDALPEGVQVGGGPAPEGVVVVEVQAAFAGQPVLVEADLRREGGVCGAHGGRCCLLPRRVAAGWHRGGSHRRQGGTRLAAAQAAPHRGARHNRRRLKQQTESSWAY